MSLKATEVNPQNYKIGATHSWSYDTKEYFILNMRQGQASKDIAQAWESPRNIFHSEIEFIINYAFVCLLNKITILMCKSPW